MCVSTTDGGGVYCWGSGANGQLGTGTTLQHRKPVLVQPPANDNVIDVSAFGDYTACVACTSGAGAALRISVKPDTPPPPCARVCPDDGNVYAWGTANHLTTLVSEGQDGSGGNADADNDGDSELALGRGKVLGPTPLPAFGGEEWVTSVYAGRDHCAFLVGGASR